MPSPAKIPIPDATESRSVASPESPVEVIVVVNGRPVSVTIAEGAVAEIRKRELNHPPDHAIDYLPQD